MMCIYFKTIILIHKHPIRISSIMSLDLKFTIVLFIIYWCLYQTSVKTLLLGESKVEISHNNFTYNLLTTLNLWDPDYTTTLNFAYPDCPIRVHFNHKITKSSYINISDGKEVSDYQYEISNFGGVAGCYGRFKPGNCKMMENTELIKFNNEIFCEYQLIKYLDPLSVNDLLCYILFGFIISGVVFCLTVSMFKEHQRTKGPRDCIVALIIQTPFLIHGLAK